MPNHLHVPSRQHVSVFSMIPVMVLKALLLVNENGYFCLRHISFEGWTISFEYDVASDSPCCRIYTIRKAFPLLSPPHANALRLCRAVWTFVCKYSRVSICIANRVILASFVTVSEHLMKTCLGADTMLTRERDCRASLLVCSVMSLQTDPPHGVLEATDAPHPLERKLKTSLLDS
jgi:hypothetical protein